MLTIFEIVTCCKAFMDIVLIRLEIALQRVGAYFEFADIHHLITVFEAALVSLVEIESSKIEYQRLFAKLVLSEWIT